MIKEETKEDPNNEYNEAFNEEQQKEKSDEFDQNLTMVGDPCYQVYRRLDYKILFNNQNTEQEMHTKILLNLPMVSQSRID